MANQGVDIDVLIVGAGPAGLFLANECARHGLRWRIVEKRAAQSQHSKALAVFPRSLEIFDMAGIAGPFLAAANRVDTIAVVTSGRTLARVPFVPDNTPYPFVAMVPQDVTERLLVEALGNKGGAVEYRTEFLSAVQEHDRVRVMLQRDGGPETLSTAFVVGCDGAHSAVRQALQLSFDGAAYQRDFMLADIETNDALPASEMQLCPHSAGPLAIFPMSATRRRIVAMVTRPDGDAPSLALTRRLLAERAPAGIEARSLHWSGYFHIHHRRVSRLREGRMFVAGDAAHIHSPFGGQGMNTGLQDVWNLAWKLALALRGHGNEALLDSYTAERVPVIKGVIDTTDLMTRTMGTANRWAEALRNVVLPVAARLGPFRHALVQRLSELGIRYRGSPIVEGDGERFVDNSILGGGIRDRFLLFLDQRTSATLMEAAERLVATHADVVELRVSPHSGLTLVRPDGYVAAADKAGGLAALATMQTLMERQTGRG